MKTLIGLIVIALIGYGAWTMLNKSGDKTETVVKDEDKDVSAKMAPFADGTYKVATTASSLEWKGSKPLITNYFDNGTIDIRDGALTVAQGNIIGGTFTIDINSINTVSSSNDKAEPSKLSTHLKSDDFFDAVKYPTSTFVITDVVANSDNTHNVTGNLTIKGITKPITLIATIRQDGDTITATAGTELDRTLWDIRYSSGKFFQDLGDKIISDMFTITLNLVVNKTN